MTNPKMSPLALEILHTGNRIAFLSICGGKKEEVERLKQREAELIEQQERERHGARKNS